MHFYPVPLTHFSKFPLHILLNLVVEILAQLLRILKFSQHVQLCRSFSQSLSHMPDINPLPLPWTAFPNHFSLIILLFRGTHSGLLTSLKHLQNKSNSVRRLLPLLPLIFSWKQACGFKTSECVSVNVSMISRLFLEPTFRKFAGYVSNS